MKNLYFDFEIAGVPVKENANLGIILLEFKMHAAIRLVELQLELNKHPEGGCCNKHL